MYNKLESITYLVNNSNGYNEWVEAGLWDVVVTIIKSDDNMFTEDFLKEWIEFAQNN